MLDLVGAARLIHKWNKDILKERANYLGADKRTKRRVSKKIDGLVGDVNEQRERIFSHIGSIKEGSDYAIIFECLSALVLSHIPELSIPVIWDAKKASKKLQEPRRSDFFALALMGIVYWPAGKADEKLQDWARNTPMRRGWIKDTLARLDVQMEAFPASRKILLGAVSSCLASNTIAAAKAKELGTRECELRWNASRNRLESANLHYTSYGLALLGEAAGMKKASVKIKRRYYDLLQVALDLSSVGAPKKSKLALEMASILYQGASTVSPRGREMAYAALVAAKASERLGNGDAASWQKVAGRYLNRAPSDELIKMKAALRSNKLPSLH